MTDRLVTLTEVEIVDLIQAVGQWEVDSAVKVRTYRFSEDELKLQEALVARLTGLRTKLEGIR